MSTSTTNAAEVRGDSGQPFVCGVVVTFFPDGLLPGRIAAIAAECAHVIVVDNGSPSGSLASLSPLAGRVEVLRQTGNLGVAVALNVGLRRARALGYAWVVTFDQDSKPEPGLVAGLWATHERLPQAAVIGPCINEAGGAGSDCRWVRRHPRWPLFFQRVGCDGDDLPAVTSVISSGSLIELETWARLGGFDEGLFIDYVDTDYCLRVLRSGRSLAVAGAAKLHHRLGARQTGRILGKDLRPMHHGVLRHYYLARNRVRLWRRHALAVPHWALFDFAFAGLNTFRVLAFEEAKRAKLKALVLGTWDGLRGRSGACPEDRRRVLQP